MINRTEILAKAFHDCIAEMYAKSQPEADWDNIVEEYQSGKIQKNETIYDRHYLSMDEFLYIRDKYKEAYNIKSHWKDDIEVVEKYLQEGGNRDKYIPDYTDKNGNHHPGYRSYEELPPLKEQLKEIMKDYYIGYEKTQEEVAQKMFDKVMEYIISCKNYYRFDREEENFNINISLGPSPCSDKETVKKWWKENYNQDIEIEEHNPKLFWYRDEGYTDEDLAEEFDSENWKEIVDKEWKEEIEEKKREHEEKLKKLIEENEKA